ncbi:hypothetical protein ABEW19_28060 [Paenibacillus illinoisensis]|uniref:hypothetical protein n=1 Tax=Paenibacillus illinoisensis TaxID=59845 RepID=UPI003D265417
MKKKIISLSIIAILLGIVIYSVFIDSNLDPDHATTTQISKEAKEEKPSCSEGSTRDRTFCYIENKKYSQAGNLLEANEEKTDPVLNVLRTYTSCMTNSALPDECGKVSNKVFSLKDKKIIDSSRADSLVFTLETKRLAELEEEQERINQEFNEKYYPPQIGMTAEKVLESTWGKPTKINKTTNRYGVSEQWVYYGQRYLYFDNGSVTSIQE